ncbi:M20/M25/M40 family metallo-hydrolase [Salinicoccus cyprini]|uniref:M20/M25/M40 family metallo-hydrolase n=1 Tax=Salinicoccus cyprini TaxID=2493691 RepID=A0A558ASU4_9STAP|nr:M20/M25/M40 family metallo-hydrolase [Salinicoccus cyprini]TVT27343.1 M20/M25/M40 family metallo-hydrolase [Salinicoccus cyprini]
MFWESQQQLEELVCQLVSWESRTGTEGEILFPFKLKDELVKLEYFERHPEHIALHDAGRNRNGLSALYKHGSTSRTIILMSHFDTVHTKEFGSNSHLAFSPHELGHRFKEIADDFPEEVRADILSDDYLFGRGTMDMKMGIALHMHLVEKAIAHDWPINLLLLTVPDEEVDSAGMRTAVDQLEGLAQTHDLDYALFLNSEPSFTQYPDDPNYYFYSGTIGKIMPSVLFYGVETHVGEPLRGLNAHYMASFLNQQMEFTNVFDETAYGERTPLPVTLKYYDMKADYSAQTSNHVASLYNVFAMEQNADDIFSKFHELVEDTMTQCQNHYEAICRRENTRPVGSIRTMSYQALHDYILKKHGQVKIDEIITQYIARDDLDDREKSMQITNRMLTYCKELVPLAVTLFVPPYYPAVNASEDPLVRSISGLTQEFLNSNYGIVPKEIHYFNGISDASYVSYDSHDDSWETYKANTPVWGKTYTIPFQSMQKLQVPHINIGPFGKDPHKLTERLHKQSGYEITAKLLEAVVKHCMTVTV